MLASDKNGCAALIAGGACAALVEALARAEKEHTNISISSAMGTIACDRDGRLQLAAALSHALHAAEAQGTESKIARALALIKLG